MIMTFDSTFYPGNFARPRAEYSLSDDAKLFCLAVPWGSHEAYNTLTAALNEPNLENDETATEITLPFADGQNLSHEAKKLKTFLTKINLNVYQQFNKTAYTTGCEATLFSLSEHQLSWVQIGQPHILLLRNNVLTVLQSARDLSVDFSMASPLPYQLLGIDKHVEAQVQNISVKHGDQIVLYTGTTLPNSFFGMKNFGDHVVDSLVKVAIQENENSPFGIAVVYIK